MAVGINGIQTPIPDDLYKMLNNCNLFTVPCAGWATVNQNGTWTSLSPLACVSTTGAVDDSSWGNAYTPQGLLAPISSLTSGYCVIDYDYKIVWIFDAIRLTSDANAYGQISLSRSLTSDPASLDSKGFGINIANYALSSISYGSAQGTSSLGVSLTDNMPSRIMIIHNPAIPQIDWYVNGILRYSETTSTKIPSGNATDNETAVKVHIKKPSGLTNSSLYLINPILYSAR